MAFLRKFVSIGIVFVFIIAISIGVKAEDRLDNPKGIIVYGERCREVLEHLLTNVLAPLAENIGLAEMRVDIKDLDMRKNEPYILLEISARVLESAYLVGYNLDAADDPQKYVTEELKRVFNAKPFEPVFEVSCPAPYGVDAFSTQKMQSSLFAAIQQVETYWLQNGETEYLREFSKQFSGFFDPAFNELIYKLAKGHQYLFQEVMFDEQYTDYSFKELKIFVYTYAVCGVLKDPLPGAREEVWRGIQDLNKFKKVAVTLKLGNNNKEYIGSQLRWGAEDASSQVLDYFKGVVRKETLSFWFWRMFSSPFPAWL